MSITVQVRQGNLEQAMRVLKKKVQREGIIKDFRAKSVYEKPSAKKRRKKKEGIKSFDFTPMFVVYILWSRLFVSP